MANVVTNIRSFLGFENFKEDREKIQTLEEKYEKLVSALDEQNKSLTRLTKLLTEDRNAINALIEVSSFVKEQQDEIVKYIVFNDESLQNEKTQHDDFVN